METTDHQPATLWTRCSQLWPQRAAASWRPAETASRIELRRGAAPGRGGLRLVQTVLSRQGRRSSRGGGAACATRIDGRRGGARGREPDGRADRGLRRAPLRRRGLRRARGHLQLGLPGRASSTPGWRQTDRGRRALHRRPTRTASAPRSAAAPATPRGSDILLTAMATGRLPGRDRSPRRARQSSRWPPELLRPRRRRRTRKPPGQGRAGLRSAARSTPRWPALFDDDASGRSSRLRCLGCGACAFVCPTCACFDIQDEGGREAGQRLRCWDSCGFALFTLHTSGHNPRQLQSQRWRQRSMHKFAYYPERLRHARLRGLRPLLARLPGGHEPCANTCEARSRRRSHEPQPNIYKPYLMRIEKITDEAPGVKTFRLEFVDEAEGAELRLPAPASSASTRCSARASAPSASPRRPRARATSSARSARPAA